MPKKLTIDEAIKQFLSEEKGHGLALRPPFPVEQLDRELMRRKKYPPQLDSRVFEEWTTADDGRAAARRVGIPAYRPRRPFLA